MCDPLVVKGGSYLSFIIAYFHAAGKGEDTSAAPEAQVKPSGMPNQGRIDGLYIPFNVFCTYADKCRFNEC